MGWRQSLFPPARETQPRGSGAERIIKAGKRGWERRGGAWGGGFTRPGSCYTGLGARASPCIPPTPHPPSRCTWTQRPCAPPGARAATTVRSEGACRSPGGSSLAASPRLGTVAAGRLPSSCPEPLHSNPRGWPGIAFDVTPWGEV